MNLKIISSFMELIYIIFLSICIYLYQIFTPLSLVLFSFLLYYLAILFLMHNNSVRNFIAALLSFCIGQASFLTSSIICSILLFPLYGDMSHPPYDVIVPLSGLIALCLVHVLFKFSKYENGIRYLCNSQATNLILLIGGLIIVALTVIKLINTPTTIIKLIPLCVSLAAILLFFLWQRCIRQYYLTKLRNLELESLRQELEEKDAMIERLMKNNEEQAQMIHKDNKLVPAMLSAVTDYLLAAESGGDAAHTGEALAAELKGLADERLTILTTAFETAATLPLLHCASVDAMLSYMQKRALQEKITFEVKLHPGFAGRIGTDITEADLSHLLSDLLENAVIATKHAKNRRILVHLGILYDAAVAEVSDSGQAFEPSVYQDFGLQKHSTHLDSGGSGIGLMDIWKLKKKYAASLHIYEYADEAAPYTKKISVVFDHRKHYLIRTCRPEELVKMQARSDLYILPLNDSKE